MEKEPLFDIYHRRTRSVFLWSRLLKTPFWAIYSMLPFILFRDLSATPFQIAAMIALKPGVSLFAVYWSAAVNRRRDRLLSNIFWAGLIGLVPFFFFPVVDNPWFFVFASGLYMLLHRGVVPAWMEVIKLNLSSGSRQKVFAFGSAFAYLGDGLLPFLFGPLLDSYWQAWRWIFPATALLSLLSLLLLYRIPIRLEERGVEPFFARGSFFSHLKKPWEAAFSLLKRRADFGAFQTGFMLCGSGLMIMQAALPVFFIDVLKISYTELAIALTLCKGLGFAATSQIWAKWMGRVDIYRFSALVTTVAFFFPLFLLAASHEIFCLYAAYIIYGIMQAGSELSWNLSGPIFSREEDSSPYTSVNVMAVGLRGCLAPGIGALALFLSGKAVFVLIAGGVLCIAASLAFMRLSAQQERALLRGH